MKFNDTFKHTKLYLALATAMLTTPGLTYAQEVATKDADVEVIKVRASGFKDSLEIGLANKRMSTNSVDTILAEDIADFPDQNIAEALQRIPGIAISRDAGEGREVTVRGLGSTFTRVQLNGMQAQSLSAGPGGVRKNRAFDFNIFASELFNQLTVYKTTSADLEEGSLGATVDLTTGRPFDFSEDVVAFNVQAAYNDQSEETDPRFSGLASFKNDDDTFGILLSASLSSRFVNNTGADTGRWEDNTPCSDDSCLSSAGPQTNLSSAWHPRFPRLADKTHDQDRTGLTASLQFVPSDNTLITVDALYAKVESERLEPFMQAISLARTNSDGIGQTYFTDFTVDGNNSLISATANDVDVRAENFISNWESTFNQFSLNVEHNFSDDLTLNAMLGTSTSELDNREITVIYEHYSQNDSRRYLDYADPSSNVSYDFSNQMAPTLSYSFDTANPANWELSEYRDRLYAAESSNDTARLDLEYFLNDNITLKGGVTIKDYSYEIDGFRADRAFASADAADGTTDGVAYGISNIVTASDGAVFNAGGQSFFMATEDQIPKFLASGGWEYAVRGGDTYAVSEESLGYFLQADLNYDIGDMPLRGNVGVRYVDTDTASTGVIDGNDVTVENSYSDTLPSTNWALDITDDLVFRAAFAEVMSRPNLGDLSPGGSVDAFNLRVSYGNPFLTPFRATNTDLGLEYYFDEGALLAIAYFEKDIESFPTSETTTLNWSEVGLPDSVLGGQANIVNTSDFEVRRKVDGGGGKLTGTEIQYQQVLDFLPGLLSNLGVMANVTFVDSNVNLSGQSDESSNFTLYYEDEKFSTRVSVANRGEYTTSFQSDDNKERYVGETTHVDFSASYQVNDKLKVSLEAINLTDEPVVNLVSPNLPSGRIWNVTKTGTQYFVGFSYKM